MLHCGFDDEGTFFSIPFSVLQSMVEVFCRQVIEFLLVRRILNRQFAQNLLYRGAIQASASTAACTCSMRWTSGPSSLSIFRPEASS